MNLQDLVERLGREVVARRLGVTPGTIRRWENKGPSARRRGDVQGVIDRHLRSRRAYQTRLRHLQERFPEPPKAEIEARPVKTPVEVKVTAPTRTVIESPRWSGRVFNIPVEEEASEVDWDSVLERAIDAWDRSAQPFGRFVVQAYRYIPFNPLYSGPLVTKQGEWVPEFTSTNYQAVTIPLEAEFRVLTDIYADIASTRIIWVQSVEMESVVEKRR